MIEINNEIDLEVVLFIVICIEFLSKEYDKHFE